MAKHDRRKRSSQPPNSRTVTIQLPLPVLGALNGVREALHGLCITSSRVANDRPESQRRCPCEGAARPPTDHVAASVARVALSPMFPVGYTHRFRTLACSCSIVALGSRLSCPRALNV